MPEISFVYDRTPQDVAIAQDLINKIASIGYNGLTDEEKELWDSELKGCRNASDLNRVGNACNIIADELYNAGILHTQITTKDDWTELDIPTRSDMNTILNNIRALRTAIGKACSPEMAKVIERVPNNPINTIEKMNLVERILYEVYNITNIILTDRQLCGEGYLCDDDRLI